MTLDFTYTSGSQIGGVEFTMQPGEIVFSTLAGHSPGVGITGTLTALLSARVNDVQVNQFLYLLRLTSTNGGFEIDPSSTSPGLLSIASVHSGDGGVWGVETKAYDGALVLPPLNPNDHLTITYDMRAEAQHLNADYVQGFSVKIGDPLHLTGVGSLTLTPASVVPLPNSWWLMLSALLALPLAGAVRRRVGEGTLARDPTRACAGDAGETMAAMAACPRLRMA